MTIRKTTMNDLAAVMALYADARAFMRESGNPMQWHGGYPPEALIVSDIKAGVSYVCEENDSAVGVFYYNILRDPTYEKIDGRWLNNQPCGVVHRIAKHRDVKGVGAFCLQWSFAQCGNIKIDTHRDNAPMRKLLEKLGFMYCGIIWLANGEERMAFQKAERKM